MKNFFRGGIAFAILSMLFGQTVAAKTESVNASDSVSAGQEQVLTNNKRPVRRVQTIKTNGVKKDFVEFKNGQVEVYQDVRLGELSLAEMRAINSGQAKAVNLQNKNYDGRIRRRAYVGAFAGANGWETIDPQVGLGLGWETRHWDFCLSGMWTQGHLPSKSEDPGKAFSAPYFYFDATAKLAQRSNGYLWFGVGGGAGAGFHRTSNTGSGNYGISYKGFLAAGWQISEHFALKMQAGALLKVHVERALNTTEYQDMGNIKPYAQIAFVLHR